jgi:DNA adenine methylase
MNMPLHYFGGKASFNGKLAKWIISKFPKHLHYCETCVGGGGVLLYKEKINSEVINDINGHLINFWKVLADKSKFKDFYTRISFLPLSEQLFTEALSYKFGSDDVEDAIQYFILNRQSRLGVNKSFVTLSKRRLRRGINEQVNNWLSSIEGLPEIVDRLEQVVIRKCDLFDLIKQEDTEFTFFYIDPPYLHETRGCKNAYTFEMSAADHERLLQRLEKIKGKFCLSGYHSDLYKKYATQNGWRIAEMEISHCSSTQKKKKNKTEVIWMNY